MSSISGRAGIMLPGLQHEFLVAAATILTFRQEIEQHPSAGTGATFVAGQTLTSCPDASDLHAGGELCLSECVSRCREVVHPWL